jgi:hypothetical protein
VFLFRAKKRAQRSPASRQTLTRGCSRDAVDSPVVLASFSLMHIRSPPTHRATPTAFTAREFQYLNAAFTLHIRCTIHPLPLCSQHQYTCTHAPPHPHMFTNQMGPSHTKHRGPCPQMHTPFHPSHSHDRLLPRISSLIFHLPLLPSSLSSFTFLSCLLLSHLSPSSPAFFSLISHLPLLPFFPTPRRAAPRPRLFRSVHRDQDGCW